MFLKTLQARLMMLVFLIVGVSAPAFAQVITGGGNAKPGDVIGDSVCKGNGFLSWFTGTKLIAAGLAVALLGYFIGRLFGKQGTQEGLYGAIAGILGLAAIKAIIAVVVSGC
ncbi:hypothetical protein [Deinococcus cellulosilyticus]|uniref:Conjugal transfer protein TrbC n=1 Tax=Deinococcus cellulosilyticus (strain DSM 18568 / NBRC 106333 / KACC 11606 / 5516J-15) TaxID=1223518 RepID=A0A511NAI3_DEIC1|nr:hypothetical protein [Deinococcus cellulosilyticus]GEM49823.1 hypothetical protein DC3_54580 [Deinococcus cellulosilyticus NBRC 106333 = KACC 11606]